MGPPPRPYKPIQEEEDDDGGVMMGPPPPPAKRLGNSNDSDDEEDMIGPPPSPPAADVDSEEDEDDDNVNDNEENRYKIPLSNEIQLKGHTKIVSSLAVDTAGAMVLSGSYDYTVRMYDFQGMNSRLQSFRQIEPSEGHQVRSLSWSPTSGQFLCVTGSAQAKIYDRDGLTLGEFMKGDMYIRDLKNTKGHICGLTCGEWHPRNKETILTSSEDGSLRIWDVNNFLSQTQVIEPKPARPGRVHVTTCTWDRDGKRIAGGIGDGSIQIWSLKPGWGSRPDVYVEKAHTDDITSLKFSSDGRIMLSRSFDGSLKIWDMRQMKEALKAFEGLPNNYAQTNVAFSPDEQIILTGTSVEKDSTTGGLLCFYDRTKLEIVKKVGISPTCSVVQCAWHPRLNQIFATSGDKSQGRTHILYDPTQSERGACICVARAPRKKSVDDYQPEPVIHNPHALPLFRDAPSRKRQREKTLKDPHVKAHKPEVPMTGPGHGGRVGTTGSSLLTQNLLKKPSKIPKMGYLQKQKKPGSRKRRKLREKAIEQEQSRLEAVIQLKDITGLLQSLLAKAEEQGNLSQLFEDVSVYKAVKSFTFSFEELKQYLPATVNKEEAEEIGNLVSSLKEFIPDLAISPLSTDKGYEVLLKPHVVTLSNMDVRTTTFDVVRFFQEPVVFKPTLMPVFIQKKHVVSLITEKKKGAETIKTKKAVVRFKSLEDTYNAVERNGCFMKVKKHGDTGRYVFINRQTNNLLTICVSGLKKFEDDLEKDDERSIKTAINHFFSQYEDTKIISYFIPNGLGFAYLLLEKTDDIAFKRDLENGLIYWGGDDEIRIRESFMIPQFLEAYGLDATKAVESFQANA